MYQRTQFILVLISLGLSPSVWGGDIPYATEEELASIGMKQSDLRTYTRDQWDKEVGEKLNKLREERANSGEGPKSSENAKPESATPDQNTGLKEGDKIILNGDNDSQRKVWNEQRDRESLDIRMQSGQGSFHRQNVSIDIYPDAPVLAQPPRVLEEFTDANGNVWERVRVDKQELPKFLEENRNVVRAGEMTPTIMLNVSPPRLLSENAEKSKTVMDEKAGKSTPPTIVKGELAADEKAALDKKPSDPALLIFDAVKNAPGEKAKEEDKKKLAELPVEKKPLPEKDKPTLSATGDIVFNNDIDVNEPMQGAGSEDVLRLKTVGRRLASRGPAQEEPSLSDAAYVKAGADFGNSGFDYAGFNKGFASAGKTQTPFRVLIALLALIVAFFLFRETGTYKALSLKLLEKAPKLAALWGMVTRRSKNG